MSPDIDVLALPPLKAFLGLQNYKLQTRLLVVSRPPLAPVVGTSILWWCTVFGPSRAHIHAIYSTPLGMSEVGFRWTSWLQPNAGPHSSTSPVAWRSVALLNCSRPGGAAAPCQNPRCVVSVPMTFLARSMNPFTP